MILGVPTEVKADEYRVGIRPVGADAGDQKRVMTPALAIADGATHLVVGRPILQAADPAAAADAIVAEIAGALQPGAIAPV